MPIIIPIDSNGLARFGEDIKTFFTYIFNGSDGMAVVWACIIGFMVWLILQPFKTN